MTRSEPVNHGKSSAGHICSVNTLRLYWAAHLRNIIYTMHFEYSCRNKMLHAILWSLCFVKLKSLLLNIALNYLDEQVGNFQQCRFICNRLTLWWPVRPDGELHVNLRRANYSSHTNNIRNSIYSTQFTLEKDFILWIERRICYQSSSSYAELKALLKYSLWIHRSRIFFPFPSCMKWKLLKETCLLETGTQCQHKTHKTHANHQRKFPSLSTKLDCLTPLMNIPEKAQFTTLHSKMLIIHPRWLPWLPPV